MVAIRYRMCVNNVVASLHSIVEALKGVVKKMSVLSDSLLIMGIDGGVSYNC